MKTIIASGKRKRAIAKATLKPGKGIFKVNNILLDNFEPLLPKLKIKEPIMLAEGVSSKVDIHVKCNGGGFMSQAEAARLAVARSLVEYDKKLEKVFLEYDRNLLVGDVRRKEPSKPNRHGKARAKRQKSYR